MQIYADVTGREMKVIRSGQGAALGSAMHGAVAAGPDGKPALLARQQFVKTGEARGDFVEIVEGVRQGQEIVAQGAFKLRNGAPVRINNSVKVEPQLVPRLENR